MFFVIIKMVRPEKHAECIDIKSKTENINISQFKHDIPRSKLQIEERMNKISILGENYSEIVRHKFNL